MFCLTKKNTAKFIIFVLVATSTFYSAPKTIYASPVTFNSSGSWTVPANVCQVTVEAWGGGAGGSSGSAGGGGGGGAYTRGTVSVTPGDNYSVTVGIGGGQNLDGGNTLFTGDDSLFVLANGGGNSGSGISAGGAGGLAQSVSGHITASYSGGNGGTGWGSQQPNNRGAGGGGGSATVSSNGNDGNGGSNSAGGAGGTGQATGGTGGRGGTNGSSGGAPGAGGGGAGNSSTAGSGGAGRVILTFTAGVGCPVTTTTIGNGSDPASVTVAPGTSIIDAGTFTLRANTGTDSVTALTVILASSGTPYNGLSEVRVTSNDGSTTYFSAISNPLSNTLNFSGGTPIPVSTTATSFKIRVTPKTHANMPAVPGASYALSPRVSAFTSTNPQAGSDTNANTLTIDNLSPDNVTSANATAGDTEVVLMWTNPVDSDFSEVIVLRQTFSAVADSPVEGTNYSIGNTIGSSVVACVTSSTTCTDSSLSNGTEYYYKIFTKDDKRNYSENGVVPTGSPATPQAPVGDPEIVQFHYRWRSDDGDETSASYGVGEDIPITANNSNIRVGDRIRLRIALSNIGEGSASNFSYQLEYASSTCSQWVSVPPESSGNLHWRMSATDNVADGMNTTNSSGISDPVGKDFVSGYFKSVSALTPTHSLANSQFTEHEFSIRSNSNAVTGLMYCFRLTNYGDTSFFSYNVNPQMVLTSVRRPTKSPPGIENPPPGSQRGGGSKKDVSEPVEEPVDDGETVTGGDPTGGGGDVG